MSRCFLFRLMEVPHDGCHCASLMGWVGVLYTLSPGWRSGTSGILAVPTTLTFLLEDHPIRIQSDNATAVVYITIREAPEVSLQQEQVERILSWTEIHVPVLSTVLHPCHGQLKGALSQPEIPGFGSRGGSYIGRDPPGISSGCSGGFVRSIQPDSCFLTCFTGLKWKTFQWISWLQIGSGRSDSPNWSDSWQTLYGLFQSVSSVQGTLLIFQRSLTCHPWIKAFVLDASKAQPVETEFWFSLHL